VLLQEKQLFRCENRPTYRSIHRLFLLLLWSVFIFWWFQKIRVLCTRVRIVVQLQGHQRSLILTATKNAV